MWPFKKSGDSDWHERFGMIADDLLQLEVNTVIKDSMTTSKMKTSRRFVLNEVARDYDNTLKQIPLLSDEDDLPASLKDSGRQIETCRDPVYWNYAGIHSFDELYLRAKRGLDLMKKRLAQPQLMREDKKQINENTWKLERIMEHSSWFVDMFHNLRGDQPMPPIAPLAFEADLRAQMSKFKELPALKDITDEDLLLKELVRRGWLATDQPFAYSDKDPDRDPDWNNDIPRKEFPDKPPLKLKPFHLTVLHKAWDIGMERVVAQTIIQLDGDITTRISQDASKELLTIHDQGFRQAMDYWRLMASILYNTAELLIGFFK